MADVLKQPIADASVWNADTLARDRGFEFRLDDGHRAELDRALATVEASDLTLPEITRETFPLASLARLLGRLNTELRVGRGFALLHGFPVDGYTETEIEKLYWGLCCHVGNGVTQNSERGFIHYVTDGARRPRQGTRGVGLPQETPLHVDLTDVASLLCVRQAPDDPPSRVASSTYLYNEILRRRPDVLERLFSGFEWGRMGEHDAGESASSGYLVPFFSHANGRLSCRYNRHWIVSAANTPSNPLGDHELELFDFIDGLLREHCFEFPFHRGDVQFCNNYTVMHGRAGTPPLRTSRAAPVAPDLAERTGVPRFFRRSDRTLRDRLPRPARLDCGRCTRGAQRPAADTQGGRRARRPRTVTAQHGERRGKPTEPGTMR